MRRLGSLVWPRGVVYTAGLLRCTGTAATAADTPNDASPDAAASSSAPATPAAPVALPDVVAGKPFRFQMVELKRASRGCAQRPLNQEYARTVLQRCIPAAADDVPSWLDASNATTALNGATFFEMEIPHQDAIVDYTVKNIGSFKDGFEAATAGIALLRITDFDDDVADTLRADVVPRLLQELPTLRKDAFHTAIKLFQILEMDDPELWAQVCKEVKRREIEIAARQSTAIRVFAALARFSPEDDVTKELFGFLNSRVGMMRSYDFSSFLSAAEKWGHLTYQDVLALLRRQGDRTHFTNARDLGVCFPACVRLTKGLLEKKDALSHEERLTLVQHLRFVFDVSEFHMALCMDPAAKDHYWRVPADVVHAMFAYEFNSDQRPPHLFARFVEYALARASAMDGRDCAITLGILRRAGLLTEDVLNAFAPVVHEALKDEALTLEEASHVALSYAAVNAKAHKPLLKELVDYAASRWDNADGVDEADLFGSHPGAKTFASLNFAAAAAGPKFSATITPEVTVRQLCDVKSSAIVPATVAAVEAELAKRLRDGAVSELDLIQAARAAEKLDDPLRRPVQAAINAALQTDVWGPYHLQLLAVSSKLDKTEYADRAVALGRRLAVSPQQLLTVVAALVKLYPAKREVQELVAEGGALLAQNNFSAALKLSKLVANTPCAMSKEWHSTFISAATMKRARRADTRDVAEALTIAHRAGAFEPVGGDDTHNKPAPQSDSAASSPPAPARRNRAVTALPYIVQHVVNRVRDGNADADGLRAFIAAVTAIDKAAVTDELVAAAAAAKPRPTHQEPAKRSPQRAEDDDAPKKKGGAKKKDAKKPAASKSKATSKAAAKGDKGKKPAAKKSTKK